MAVEVLRVRRIEDRGAGARGQTGVLQGNRRSLLEGGELLILDSIDATEKIEAVLVDDGWKPRSASSAEALLALGSETDALVGLLLLPRNTDDAWLEGCRKVVAGLNRVKWVAAVHGSQLERESVMRFIVDHVRDFLTLPLDAALLSGVLGRACAMSSVERALLEKQATAVSGRFGMVGTSSTMRALYDYIERAASSDVPVLVHGGTGTGKEKVARAIHEQSSRASGPFVALNCAAVPHGLLQSELFGYEKGAFTHAFARKKGYLESATGGTLLLDEIGEMPPESQAVLLRFLEDKKVMRVGGTQSIPIDVRVIAITNKNLDDCVAEKTFRADLYYRLAVLKIRAPDLKERRGDVEALAYHFLSEAPSRSDRRILGFDREALSTLSHYDWPGNVRELRSVVFRATQRSSGRFVTVKNLDFPRQLPAKWNTSLQDALDETEAQVIQSALQVNRWNVSRTAIDLGVSRMTLYRTMDKHGIARE